MTDWASEAADTVERVVVTVRQRTVVPARAAAKAVVYGLLSVSLVMTALALAAIALFRGLTLLTGRAWAAWLILGGIFVVAGAFCWAKRPRGNEKARPIDG